jgi:8-oxo-dGTP pyrophosphatase MutT (NUDIX family)
MNHISANPVVEGVRRPFGGSPARLQVAALPWRRKGGHIQVMLITTRETGRWILPRGWPEVGEELSAAAAREAHEEAGIDGAVSASEAGRYYYSKVAAGGDNVPCEVLVYPLEVNGVASKWKEKGQRSRKWVSPAKAAGMVTEPGLGEIIAAFGNGATKAA